VDSDAYTLAQVGAESFQWECVVLPDTEDEEAEIIASQFTVVGSVVVDSGSGSVFPPCSDTAGRTIDFNSRGDAAHTSLSSPSTGRPAIRSRSLQQGRYRVTLVFSRGTNSTAGALLPSKLRQSTTSADITVVAGSPPIITSAGVVGDPVKISSSVRSRLRAAVTLGTGEAPAANDLSYRWSVDTSDTVLASRVFATPANVVEVTLRPNVLLPGSLYTFIFTATDRVTERSTQSRV